MISGPVRGGVHGWEFGESPLDVAAIGYQQEGFFLEGVATRYRPAPGAEGVYDGGRPADPGGTSPFKTRIIVLRPTDPEMFNGTVVLGRNNVSGGFDAWEPGPTKAPLRTDMPMWGSPLSGSVCMA